MSDNSNKNEMDWLEENKATQKQGGLGFRDPESFNVALLVKQLWRLLKNLESLVAQIPKEKYYKDGDLLDS